MSPTMVPPTFTSADAADRWTITCLYSVDADWTATARVLPHSTGKQLQLLRFMQGISLCLPIGYWEVAAIPFIWAKRGHLSGLF